MNKNLIINTLRGLAIDMINKANSGHPGMALGSAPIGYTIYQNMNVDPKDPEWFNRDRFVLASGHASALLYGLLHLNGYEVSLDDLKQFRQLNSLTPGHPEYHHTPGVDATSGPLGQGIPMAVGMALAEKVLAAKYGDDLVDHYTYCLCGDGDMQEGVTFEASSLAGLWQLNKLIVFYDANGITLDGALRESNNDDIKTRYESFNWHYLLVEDGNDQEAIQKALVAAKAERQRPTIIEVKTIIGYGSAKAGTNKVHGSPLGHEDGLKAKEKYGISPAEFYVPSSIYDEYTCAKIKCGHELSSAWYAKIDRLKESEALRYQEFVNIINNEYEISFGELVFTKESQATRNSSHDIINYLSAKYPTFMGGSADLASSNMTAITSSDLFSANETGGRNINYGIREFAMSAINNGVYLHRGIKIFGATFLVFSDYLKPALKMAALMKLPNIFVFTHDSIAVGEDGPTHQPIEHLPMLRSIPNVCVLRPCDAKETYAAWQIAMVSKDTPTVIVLSRQNLKQLPESSVERAKCGAYTIYGTNECDILLIATGSEVSLAYESALVLAEDGIKAKVVSLISRDIFERQSQEYQEEVIPSQIKKRLVIEMASSFGWFKYALSDEQLYCLDHFGLSAPGNALQKEFGFDVMAVVKKIKDIVL